MVQRQSRLFSFQCQEGSKTKCNINAPKYFENRNHQFFLGKCSEQSKAQSCHITSRLQAMRTRLIYSLFKLKKIAGIKTARNTNYIISKSIKDMSLIIRVFETHAYISTNLLTWEMCLNLPGWEGISQIQPISSQHCPKH